MLKLLYKCVLKTVSIYLDEHVHVYMYIKVSVLDFQRKTNFNLNDYTDDPIIPTM